MIVCNNVTKGQSISNYFCYIIVTDDNIIVTDDNIIVTDDNIMVTDDNIMVTDDNILSLKEKLQSEVADILRLIHNLM